ncbi:MAG: DNA mismatch repair endonuclease MutL [Candidatus Abyssubacteria bacterium]
MPKINILSEDTANKIAAGEVIERPSSIVKELVENSIDAASRKVLVDLEAGGKSLVRVTDDGCGMSYEDALLCLERHATSKISCAADLDAMTTFGFRGEAIPSIAAVSKFEIVTRTHDSISGTRVVVDGGIIKSVSETGTPPGTQVTVRQLFYNMPARRKFMKSPATELGHVVNMLQRQALAHPHVNFRLTSNGRETLNLPPAASISDRLALIWGHDYANNLVHGSAGTEGLIVSGYFGTPALTRANRDHQLFFLNRRPVANRLLSQALAEAYRGIVMSDRLPVAFIFVEIDPHLVDVNVHPAKREVRFADPNGVIATLKEAVRNAFGRRTTIPVSEPPHASPAPSPTPSSNTPLFQSIRIDEGKLPSTLPALEQERTAAHSQTYPVARPTADFSAVSPHIRLIGQIFNSYLLCTDEKDLLILDQHALHERILYDQLVQQSALAEQAPTQQMLIPITVELPPDRAEILAAHSELFARIGIELQPFGPRTFAITAVTRAHRETRVCEIVRDGVDELYLGLKLKAPREILHRLMTISACKNSIKAGDPLSPQEAEMLIEGLKRLAQPPTCLHGRPLVLRLTESQIARAFGRKG